MDSANSHALPTFRTVRPLSMPQFDSEIACFLLAVEVQRLRRREAVKQAKEIEFDICQRSKHCYQSRIQQLERRAASVQASRGPDPQTASKQLSSSKLRIATLEGTAQQLKAKVDQLLGQNQHLHSLLHANNSEALLAKISHLQRQMQKLVAARQSQSSAVMARQKGLLQQLSVLTTQNSRLATQPTIVSDQQKIQLRRELDKATSRIKQLTAQLSKVEAYQKRIILLAKQLSKRDQQLKYNNNLKNQPQKTQAKISQLVTDSAALKKRHQQLENQNKALRRQLQNAALIADDTAMLQLKEQVQKSRQIQAKLLSQISQQRAISQELRQRLGRGADRMHQLRVSFSPPAKDSSKEGRPSPPQESHEQIRLRQEVEMLKVQVRDLKADLDYSQKKRERETQQLLIFSDKPKRGDSQGQLHRLQLENANLANQLKHQLSKNSLLQADILRNKLRREEEQSRVQNFYIEELSYQNKELRQAVKALEQDTFRLKSRLCRIERIAAQEDDEGARMAEQIRVLSAQIERLNGLLDSQSMSLALSRRGEPSTGLRVRQFQCDS